MRFVPKSVIVQYPQLSLLVEIWNIGSNSYGKRVYHSQSNECPNAYLINRTVIDYALNNINLFETDNSPIRFAVTGEGFCHSLMKNMLRIQLLSDLIKNK